MKANKGEWSELYAFFKILTDKKLFAADKNLEIISNKFFIFKKIIRNETKQASKIFDLSGTDICILDAHGNLLKTIDDKNLTTKVSNIFEQITRAKSATFALPEAQDLMDVFLCTQIKADSAKKSDVEGVIFDRVSNKEELLGFSVKSMVGGASTLLNAGKTTNFIYEVKNINSSKLDKINAIEGSSKIQDRLKAIVANGGYLQFSKVASKTFETNLKKIDTVFAVFVAQMLQDFFSKKARKVVDLTQVLSNNKNLNTAFQLSQSDYEYKIKSFLVSIALGMVPSKVWDGFTKAHGGYIVVKNNGDVVCYHLYNRDEFLTYLFENTKFESASSTRHDYGKIYQQNGKIYFNLNLQIRFLK